MEIIMSRHVFKKGIEYFKKNGFKKACKRTVYFFTEKKSYERLRRYTDPTPQELERQRQEKFDYAPRISILIPLYNTPENFFRELIASVQAQTYSNWELCLADGTGKDTASSLYAKECMKNDSRIVYKMLDSNDGISGNTNRALEMATGEFIALVDHDDVITPDALYHMVKALNEDPLADSVYSDEDKMDMEGKKLFEPHFKPDFNIDYLRNCNYICHMFMTRTQIAKDAGAFRKPFDGAQDFDFIFRCTEKSRHVAHVPRILYHWRLNVNSTAAVPESKLYAYDAGVNSIKEHFLRTGISMQAAMGKYFGYYKNVPVIEGNPKVSIVIYGRKSETESCKELLSKISYPNAMAAVCKASPDAINKAVSKASGEYVLLFDARITDISEDFIEQLLGYVQRKDVSAAAARTYGGDDHIYHTFLVMGIEHSFGYAFRQLDRGNNGYFMRINAPQDVSGVDITCTLIKKRDWEAVSGLDESMALTYGAADLSLKLAALNNNSDMQKDTPAMWRDTHKIVYVPYAEAKISVSSEEKWHTDEQDAEFVKKWPNILKETDRYYNVNLTKRDTNFTILSSMELKNEYL